MIIYLLGFLLVSVDRTNAVGIDSPADQKRQFKAAELKLLDEYHGLLREGQVEEFVARARRELEHGYHSRTITIDFLTLGRHVELEKLPLEPFFDLYLETLYSYVFNLNQVYYSISSNGRDQVDEIIGAMFERDAAAAARFWRTYLEFPENQASLKKLDAIVFKYFGEFLRQTYWRFDVEKSSWLARKARFIFQRPLSINQRITMQTEQEFVPGNCERWLTTFGLLLPRNP